MLSVLLACVAPCLLPSVQGPLATTAGDDPVGLEEIRPDRIRADLFFFADDEMRGRDTPSLEQRIAARFLRARVERLGFQPGADGEFFFRYPLEKRRIDPDQSSLELEGSGGRVHLAFGEDWFVGTSRDARDRSLNGSSLVAIGRGRDVEASAIDWRGRMALAVSPRGSLRKLGEELAEAGASALLVVPTPGDSDDPYPDKYRRATKLAQSGVQSVVTAPRATRERLPTYYLSRHGLRALLESAGLQELPPAGSTLELGYHLKTAGSESIDLENVCALWPGSDPDLRDEVILLSAHYDHVGVRGDDVYNGADDDGSGSMGLLAIAEALAKHGPLRRSVMLIWVSGEEKGLWGSAAWTKSPTLPEGARPVCDLNIDMIGRNAPDELMITPSPAHPAYNAISRLMGTYAPLEGFGELGNADEYWARSDHMNFSQNLHIPVAFLFSGEHEDYHRPTDTPDKIDYDKLSRVARLVFRVVCALQDDTFPS